MIEHIDKYFNPSGTVDSFSYIFNLIDVKQASDEFVITLKAQFSRLSATLKLGGVAIDSAVQVGFMLPALMSQYHGAVQDFCLGCHPLASASCLAYDKVSPLYYFGHWGVVLIFNRHCLHCPSSPDRSCLPIPAS